MLDPKELAPGEEQHEKYFSPALGKDAVQLDYRAINGRLFSCVALTLGKARAKKDAWLKKMGWEE